MTELPKTWGAVPERRVPFGDLLSGLCALELVKARQSPERAGEMIERLLNSLAFTLAMTTAGDAARLNEMVEGAVSYLYETASSHAKVARALGE